MSNRLRVLILRRRRVQPAFGSGGFALDAPVLTLTSGSDDSTPDANVDLPEDIAEGMFLESQIDTDPDFGSPITATVEFDPTAIANGELDLGLSDLENGDWYWRVRVLDEDETTPLSDWSNVEDVPIDAGVVGTPIGLLLVLTHTVAAPDTDEFVTTFMSWPQY
jgi:hypothetical protein